MTINITVPEVPNAELKPRITIVGVGGGGCNAVNNMISKQLEGVDFVVANTDAQSLAQAATERRIQLGTHTTQGLGAGARPEIGRAAAEESLDEVMEQIAGSHMAFIAAGMGGGTGTGAAPVLARAAREQGILTVGVVTKPFGFEGNHRMKLAEEGIRELEQFVDTLIIIPNQNLFRVANEKTTFADAFNMADDVLYSGVRSVTDLMVMPGLINLDFADVRTVMSEMGKAMMGTGEAEGERRALDAAESAISNPLLDDTSMAGAKGVLISITGGSDMTLFEVDEAANRIRAEVDPDACINFGSTFDPELDGKMRVSVVATGIDANQQVKPKPTILNIESSRPSPITIPSVEKAEEEIAETLKVEEPAVAEAEEQELVLATEEEAAEIIDSKADAVEEEVADKGEDKVVAEEETQAAPPPATPSADAEDAFIPPAPAEVDSTDTLAVKPAPVVEQKVENVIEEKAEVEKPAEILNVKAKAPSLFERVTGIGTARNKKPEPEVTPAPEKAKEPDLGGLNPTDRIQDSQSEDDLLDIPAFLRRQAN